MSRYDVIGRMNACFTELEQALGALQQQIAPLRLLAARVFSLPEVEKGQEHQAISHIAVEQHVGQAARDLALEHYQRLFIHHNRENVSSKAAVRLPGVICGGGTAGVSGAANAAGAHQPTEGRTGADYHRRFRPAPEQRFEFVHTHLHGLITLSAYRTLTALTNPDSVRFGWANKHIIKTSSGTTSRRSWRKA